MVIVIMGPGNRILGGVTAAMALAIFRGFAGRLLHGQDQARLVVIMGRGNMIPEGVTGVIR